MNRRQLVQSLAGVAAIARLPRVADAADRAAVNFLVVGDWGRGGSNHQRDVAQQMGIAAASVGVGFVISVGDNFYEEGVTSVSDPQWLTSFEDVYRAPALQIPWYPALGNHDYMGSPRAQIEYSRQSPRWRMPNRYYTISGATVGAPHLDIFVIDTSPMVHQYRDHVHSSIARNIADQDVSAQVRWLEESLTNSTAPWKLVVGHHTIYSGGSTHGNTPEIVELIVPLLKRHGVQAYINGHDHDLQHVRRDGINYIGCGAGSQVRPVHAIQGTQYCEARSGFGMVLSAPDALTVEFRDYNGLSLYRTTLSPSMADAGGTQAIASS